MSGARGRVLDRPLEPGWLDAALRIGRDEVAVPEARSSLEVALRDADLADEARGKTVTALVRVWIDPQPPACEALLWARQNLADAEDLLPVHYVALVAAYPFFADVCAAVGRSLSLEERVLTPAVRAAIRAAWGDRRTIHNAVQRGIKTLRAFGVLTGAPGTSASKRGPRLVLPENSGGWAAHALLIARRAESIDEHELRAAPEYFGVELPAVTTTGYGAVERHREGGGRTVWATM